MLDESRNAYLIGNGSNCDTSARGYGDLLYKSSFELTDDGANVTVAVGSATYNAELTNESVGVYNDYHASTGKTLIMPETDFSPISALISFNITSSSIK
jgi:hypothetical protein